MVLPTALEGLPPGAHRAASAHRAGDTLILDGLSTDRLILYVYVIIMIYIYICMYV